MSTAAFPPPPSQAYYPAPPPTPPIPQAPPPPRGPGVQPPFPAPPVEGRGKRIGMSLGIAAGVVVLVCGGGLAALIGLGTSATKALDEQAHKVVGDYITALQDKRYDKAYAMLCRKAQENQSPAAFRRSVAAMEPIRSFTVGTLDMTDLSAPVDAVYDNGGSGELTAYLGQNQDTGALELCDLE